MITRNSFSSLALFLAAAAGLQAQTVTVDKSSLNFSAQTGGSAVTQTINVGSSTGGAVFFAVQPNTSWLKCNPCTGTTPSAVTITADPTGLQVGSYSGSLTVSGGTGTSAVVSVNFGVGAIGASPASVPFAYTIGGSVPNAVSITLTGQAIGFTAAATTALGGNWLQVIPASGTAPGLIAAQLNSAVVGNLAAGTYNGSITVTPSSGPAITIPVTLTVSPQPPVTVSATSVSLAYQLNGNNNSPSQTLSLATTGPQALGFSLTSTVNANPSGRNWILLNPTTGQIPAGGSAQVTVGYDTTTQLPAGTYTGSISVQVTGGVFPNSTSQQTVNVTLLVSSSPLLVVPSSTLTFLYEINGALPAAKNFTPCSTAVVCTATSGQSNVTVSAAAANTGTWLAVNPASGTTGQAFAVSVIPGSLAVGTYQGTITVTMPGAGNTPQTIPVQLTVANDPELQTSLSSLSFPYQIGQSLPPAQAVSVSTSTGAPLNYTVAAAATGCSWVVLGGSATGATPGTFTVSVNPTGVAAGTYTCNLGITGTVPSTGAAAINSLTLPVTLVVSANPLLTVTLPGNPQAPPFFTATQGGSAPPAQNIVLGSTAPGSTLNYAVSLANGTGTNCGGNWLFVSPQSGSTASGSNTITVSVLPGLLSAGGGCGSGGTYTGTITITATNPGQGNPPVDNATSTNPISIPVTFQVTAGTLTLSSSTLNFTQANGATAPATQTVNVTSTGAALNYTVAVNSQSTINWLAATPASGNTPGAISISVDGSKLTPGSYTGYVTVTAPNAGNSPANIQVNFTVTPGTISAPTATLNFTQVVGGPAPTAQAVAVSGTSSLTFSVSTAVASPVNGTWLSATVGTGTATSGATPANVQVSVNAGSLAAGTYTGTVNIASPGASGSPIQIPVSLTVTAPASLTVSPASLTFNYTIGATAPQAQSVQLAASASAPFTGTVKTTDGGNWLAITPASGTAGTTATPISVSINSAALTAAGNYTGTITFTSTAALSPATVNVSLTVLSIPTPVITGLQNAASYVSTAVAPGENIVIYGTGIGPAQLATLQVASGLVTTSVAGTQVFFDGTPAPIIYTSAGQTSVMVPNEIGGRTSTQITVMYQGLKSAPVTYNVVAAVPGIYTQNLSGTGPGAILNQDYSVNGPQNGTAKGSIVQVYLTGTGDTSPALVTGLVNTAIKTSLLTYTATVGGQPAAVVYQGTAPGEVEGVMQFNVQIPANAASGPQQIVISSTSGSTTYSTQSGVTVQVQ